MSNAPDAAALLAPLQFARGATAPNRMTLAPMTNQQSNPDGTLGPAELAWLERRARGGFGVVITCAAHISLAGQGWPNELGAFADHLIPGLRELASAIRTHGSLAILQINHAGSRSPSAVTGRRPVSASEYELDLPGFQVPRALEPAEIDQVVADCAAAARRAHQAGFHGVELHGANGYLITQFLSAASNSRTDSYGGALANRARLARESLRAAREAVPDDFLVGIRLSSKGPGLEVAETTQVARWLAEDGADFIDLSGREALPSVRRAVGATPVIAGNRVWTVADALAVRAAGADLVFLASAAIGNPDWPTLAASDPGFEPVREPYDVEHLAQVAVSPAFLAYLRPRPGTLKGESSTPH